MKNTSILAAAVALVASCSMAADVYSSNMVGYTKVNVDNALTMIGTQFVQVGAADNTQLSTLQDLVDITGLPSLDEEGAGQTVLRAWVNGKYTNYYWVDEDSAVNIFEDASFANTWVDGNYEVVEDTIPLTQGAWLQTVAGSTGTITISGQVPTAAAKTVEILNALTMLSAPSPVEYDIQKISLSGLPSLDEEGAGQTVLRAWINGKYSNYYWVDEDSAVNIFEDASFANTWVDGNYEIVTDKLPVGQGFWIQTLSGAAGTVTFAE